MRPIPRTAVIGGGISGSFAALRLARMGHEVVLLERSPNLGGLVVSFSVNGTPLECFYHHVFPSEREMIQLIDELGLGPRFQWLPSTVGVLTEGRIWPFTSPTDLLRFRPLPFLDRIRTGLGSLRLTGSRWKNLDDVPARDWLRKTTGDRAVEVLWDPLLRFKFGDAGHAVPASWMAARFRQRASARGLLGERLGYLRGGFRQLFDAMALELERRGVSVRTGVGVSSIDIHGGRTSGITLDDGSRIESDAVLYAGQLPNLAGLVPEETVDPKWTQIGRLGAVCIILELAKPLSDIYWTNVCSDDVPFGALIEHTNLVPPEDYGGTRLVYLGCYFTPDDPVAQAGLEATAEAWVSCLEENLPAFTRDQVLAVHPFRTPYAAPLVSLGYRDLIPPVRTHIGGLYVATTAQIYPEDRGMNEGLRLATRAADAILSDTSARGHPS